MFFCKIDGHKRKSQITIRCLRDKVERLEKELSITENSFKIKKEEAVSRVRNFWRNLIVGDTHGEKWFRQQVKSCMLKRRQQ